MGRTLCFDFGNTRLKCAVFSKELEDVWVLDIGDVQTVASIVENYQPEKTILSSVIEHDPAIEELLSSKTRFHKLSSASKLPFHVSVSKPETVGADRLALSAAAVNFYPGKHNLVIGLGSCITYNFISKHRHFLGGSISPGMEMRFRSMHEYTALLPQVKAETNYPLIGYDTKTNMLSGVQMGMLKEIDGIIDEYSLKYSNFNVLLTGGDVAFFAPHLKNKIFADPYLIFKGLYAISEYNNH